MHTLVEPQHVLAITGHQQVREAAGAHACRACMPR
jgi:hypothetical protein